jgi:hypothetical protein
MVTVQEPLCLNWMCRFPLRSNMPKFERQSTELRPWHCGTVEIEIENGWEVGKKLFHFILT